LGFTLVVRDTNTGLIGAVSDEGLHVIAGDVEFGYDGASGNFLVQVRLAWSSSLRNKLAPFSRSNHCHLL
jgi:hypothetical protein